MIRKFYIEMYALFQANFFPIFKCYFCIVNNLIYTTEIFINKLTLIKKLFMFLHFLLFFMMKKNISNDFNDPQQSNKIARNM